MVPCRSRWSWVRLVKPATSNTTPSTRWKEMACEETSMEAASRPRSRMSASRACTSVDSGVVRRLGIGSPPARISMVPIRPGLLPERLQQGVDEVGGGGLAVGACHAEEGRCPAPSGPALVDQRGQPAHDGCAAPRPAAPGRRCRGENASRRAPASSVRTAAAPASTAWDDEVGPVPLAPGRATYRSPGWTAREFREIPVTGTEPEAPGTTTPIASPMAASGTAATAVGRKPGVESVAGRRGGSIGGIEL